jgi:glycosyltransferase involved in cell wall biosynthesis
VENDIDFIFNSYGSTKHKFDMASLLKSIDYAQNIHINGFCDTIYDKYMQHDIFIFPTKGEGFGNVMMEAIAHGLIVLAFDNTAITNFAQMGFHLNLVQDGSLEALKERLLYIANNLEQEREHALNNATKAKEIFAPKREAMDYLQLLV